MLRSSEEFTDRISVVKRLVFASAVLPPDCPHYWDIVSSFASKSESDSTTQVSSLTSEKAKAFIENLKYVEPETFNSDSNLQQELHAFIGHKKQPLGIILLSPNNTCRICKSKLLVKADRSSRVTTYSDTFGTIESTHYRKVCKNFRSSCPFVQHYGFYSMGGSDIIYDEDFHTLPYFMSARETAFEMAMLKQLDAEILIGQLSYKQRSEIYNVVHGYDKAKKKVSGDVGHIQTR